MKKDFKEDLFVAHWLKTHNGTQSAIAAGYSERSARTTAHQLLKKPNIIKKIKEHQKKIMAKYEVTEDRIIKEWAKIAFSTLQDYLEFDEEGKVALKNSKDLSDEEFSAISEVTNISKITKDGDTIIDLRFRLHDKQKALEALTRYLGLFNDQTTVGIKQINVQVDDEDKEDK